MKINIASYRFFTALSVLAGLLMSAVVLSAVQYAYADAPPGCYLKVGDGYITAGSDCLSVSGYKSTNCYVGEATNGGKAPDFKEAPCGSVKITQIKSLSSTLGSANGAEVCGRGDQAVKISIKIGCTRRVDNPILDALFAVLRFGSVGVGIVLVGSAIVSGIQYSFSRGDPGATAKSKAHLSYIAIALLLYLFTFALLNFLVPGGLLS